MTPEAGANMGGEEFANRLEARPGACIRVGAEAPRSKCDFNDEVTPFGSPCRAELVLSRMAVGQAQPALAAGRKASKQDLRSWEGPLKARGMRL